MVVLAMSKRTRAIRAILLKEIAAPRAWKQDFGMRKPHNASVRVRVRVQEHNVIKLHICEEWLIIIHNYIYLAMSSIAAWEFKQFIPITKEFEAELEKHIS